MPPRKSLVNGGKPASTASNASTTTGNKARKNTRTSLDGRNAVKTKASLPGTASDAEEIEEDDEEEVVEVRKSSTASPAQGSSSKRKSTDSSSEDEGTEDEVDVQASLLEPRKKSGRDNAVAPVSVTTTVRRSSRSASPAKVSTTVKVQKASKPASKSTGTTTTTKRVPDSVGKPVARARASKKSESRSKSTTVDEESSDDDNENVRTVRSTSARGYNWDAEVIEIPPHEVATRLSYHEVIKTSIERDGETTRVKFKTGDWIFVAPDPHYLPHRSEEIDLHELQDDEWWIAEIISCCSLPQEGEADLGVLKVKWAYSKDDVLRKETQINESYKKKLAEYRMDKDERIMSDHQDFIGIDAYGGDASGMYNFLNITGWKVEDQERMGPVAKRKLNKGRKPTRLLGFNGKAQWYEKNGEDADPADDAGSVRPAKKAAKKPASKKKPSSTASKSASKKPSSGAKKSSSAKKATGTKSKR